MLEVELKTVWKAMEQSVVAGMSHNPLRVGYDNCKRLTYLPDLDMVRVECNSGHQPNYMPRSGCAAVEPIDEQDMLRLAGPTEDPAVKFLNETTAPPAEQPRAAPAAAKRKSRAQPAA